MSAARLVPTDRGLSAVARVRAVHERDSRLGLAQAHREQHQHAAVLTDLERSLRSQDATPDGSAHDFVARRNALTLLGTAIGEARHELAVATQVTAAALDHWHRDKSRLSAVEGLLDRRATERQAERVRAETRELDDVAARLWQRRASERP
jgi:flagellar export protein FliJ